MKESGLRIRVENELREEFLLACKKHDLTGAQVLRSFMRSYVEVQRIGKKSTKFKNTFDNTSNFGSGVTR